jgi:hypothetical protein
VIRSKVFDVGFVVCLSIAAGVVMAVAGAAWLLFGGTSSDDL